MSQQQQYPGQSFLAGIEKLVDQILFVSDVPGQQIGHEYIGKRLFPVEHLHHGLLVDFHHRAIGHCSCGAHAEWLPSKATLSEEISLVQNADGGFLPDRRHNGEFYLPFLYVKNSIARVALSKDRLLLRKSFDLSTVVDGRKECLGIELAEFPGRCYGCHNCPPLKGSECTEGNFL